MSLTIKQNLTEIAKIFCRGLRKKSTPAEKKLWEKLRNRKFHNLKIYRQHPIFHDISGVETFFIADFYCYDFKLIIELDGPIHQYSIKHDKVRAEILSLMGYKIIRFKNENVVKDVYYVMREIEIYVAKLKDKKHNI